MRTRKILCLRSSGDTLEVLTQQEDVIKLFSFGRFLGLFINTDYSKEDLERSNLIRERWLAGEEIIPDCDRCNFRFVCYTSLVVE